MSDLTRPPGGAHGSTNEAGVVTHRLSVEPSRSMRSVTVEIEALLDSLGEGPRRTGALLATELISQVVGGTPPSGDDEPVALTIELTPEAICLEAMGPLAPSIGTDADSNGEPADPLADWGRFILDRLADRWGVGEGARPEIWAVMEAPS